MKVDLLAWIPRRLLVTLTWDTPADDVKSRHHFISEERVESDDTVEEMRANRDRPHERADAREEGQGRVKLTEDLRRRLAEIVLDIRPGDPQEVPHSCQEVCDAQEDE